MKFGDRVYIREAIQPVIFCCTHPINMTMSIVVEERNGQPHSVVTSELSLGNVTVRMRREDAEWLATFAQGGSVWPNGPAPRDSVIAAARSALEAYRAS